MSSLSRHPRRLLPTQRSMCAFAFGARTGVRITRVPSPRKSASNAWANLVSRSWIRKRGCSIAVVEIDAEVPRLLEHPGTVGIARARDVLDPAAPDANEYEDVQPPQQNGVDGEEVACEHRRGLLTDERAPGETVTLRRRRNTGSAQDVRTSVADTSTPSLRSSPTIQT
jgi:hypothetical protein